MSWDFQVKVEEYKDVSGKDKKTLKLNIDFTEISNATYTPQDKDSNRVELNPDEYEAFKSFGRKKARENQKKVNKKVFKIPQKQRLRWKDGQFLSNAEMEALTEISKRLKIQKKTLASQNKKGSILKVLTSSYNQHNAKKLILETNQANPKLFLNLKLSNGKTYSFRGKNILANKNLNKLLDKELNQGYYAVRKFGEKYDNDKNNSNDNQKK